MVIVVNRDVVRLDEPEDLKGFKVVVEEGTESQVMQALAQVGRMADRDTAWVRADAVRTMAEGRVGKEWDGEFRSMLDYAEGKGWLSDSRAGAGPGGPEIRAHIEWLSFPG